MGSPSSAVVANLYMEFFEELALETAPTRPDLLRRRENGSLVATVLLAMVTSLNCILK